MISQTLSCLDEVVAQIKEKEHNKSYFSKENLFQFEFKFLLCMDIVRFELLITGEISDLTADAISQIFAFGTFEFYFRDYPEIYEQCSQLLGVLSTYNEQLRNHDSLGLVRFENSSWNDYFNDRVAFFFKP